MQKRSQNRSFSPYNFSSKNRRGLSTIVVTLIIILVSLVAVGIIWIVVRNVIQTGTEEIAMGQFTLDAKIINVNLENSSNNVNLTVKRNPGEGEFSVIPRDVSLFFNDDGIYNATAFTNNQTENNGITIQVEFDGNKVFEVPDAILQLNSISDKTVEVEKTISFTASITDSSIEGAVFSLQNNSTGATIDPSSGKFVWTPSKSHGNIQDVLYNFDIIVKKGAQEDKENFTITVKQAYVELEKQSEPEPEQTTSELKELGIASFVDESKDPQSYVDRYNSEATYKKWFDDNYSEYSSIYEAVGLEAPKELAPFVDESKDPQSYVDRYNNEIIYKEWFDKTYPDITIYEAVGLEAPEIKEPEFGQCGEGTRLIDGVCTIFNEIEHGQCGEGTELVGKVCEIIGKTKVSEKPWWQFW